MKKNTWKRYIVWMLPVVAAFALAALMAMPQEAFAVEAEETAETVAAEEPELPVGGWSPAEMIKVPDDVEIPNGILNGFSDKPAAKKSARKAVNGDSDGVFTRSASTVGYNALTSDAKRQYYQSIDAAAVSFMNAEKDLEPTYLVGSNRYVFAALNYAGLGLTTDEAMQAFLAYDYDHPAYYWINSSFIPYSATTLYMCAEEEYASVDVRMAVNAMVSAGIRSYAKLAESGADTLDEIALVHDKIVNDIDYAYDSGNTPESAKWAHSVHGVFDPDHRKAVCEGYADAFAMVMNYLGIPNYYIVGTASSGGGHAWNAVSADGGDTYLYMDLTWDDAGEGSYTYRYFGMPASDFEIEHFKDGPDGTGSNWLYAIPESLSDSFENTYFKQGGFYYDQSISDVGAFASKAVAKASRAGGCVSFMASAPSELWNVANALGVGLSYYTVSYKSNDYYFMITKTDAVHDHDWTEPEYTWSSDKGAVTAVRICEAPNCEIGMETETVATTHDIINATCEEDGVDTYTAEFENEAFTTQTKEIVTEAFGHDWGEWEIVQEATEDDPGLRVRTCHNDPTHIEEEVIPQLPHLHVMISYEETPAACEEDGNTAYWQCTRCDQYFADAEGEIPIEEDSWIIPAHGHDFGEWTEIPASGCDNPGLRERVCSICGLIDEENLNPDGHDWEETYTINKEATCTEDGSKARHCKNCGAVEESQVIPALGHAYGEWNITEEATCTGTGSRRVECSRCNHSFEETIAALGHDVVEHEGQDPTCVDSGWAAYETCSRCDYTTYEELPATGVHTWKHYKAAAGLLRNGIEYDYCTVCGAKKNTRTLAGYAGYYVKSLKVTKAKKAFTVKWAKQSAANQKKFSGYQIRYSLKANMAGAKYAKASKSSKSKKIGKLLKKKKYYVQVRTYTVKGGKTFYSKWSPKKSVKTK